jgi:hypothetical protein
MPNCAGMIDPTGIAGLLLAVTVAGVDQSFVTVQVTTEAPVDVVHALVPETLAV